ncbi:MAG: hypothetical protein FJ152_04775 [Firmicutes bacterium]|nr:hypothetical protein [Bacillota bacterium]
MAQVKGKIALIGSGELSGTMVETHKTLIAGIKTGDLTLFLDTPAGFQENVDLISGRAVKYFNEQVLHEMEIVSFKSAEATKSEQAEQTFGQLGRAGYVLIGPGSPTYIVRQLETTPVPTLLGAMINRGGCLVAASAAALSVGSWTLPVYEIYKVGQPLHWVSGLKILGKLGLELVVIPHWNNAEGGNHDTRFCYMGEKRFTALSSMLPSDITILGIDEHTVCVLDFAAETASVDGLGQVTIRHGSFESSFSRGETISFDLLQGKPGLPPQREDPDGTINYNNGLPIQGAMAEEIKPGSVFWERMHKIEDTFQCALLEKKVTVIITQLLEADQLLWQAHIDLENPDFITQGREIFREMIVLAGTAIEELTTMIPDKLKNLVAAIVALREELRDFRRWGEADRIRDILHNAGIVLEDTETGPRWKI